MEEMLLHISTTVGINTGRRLADHSLRGKAWSDMDTATTLRGCTLSAMVGTDVATGLRDGLDSAQGVQGQSKACLGQRGPRYLGAVLSLLGGVCRVGPSF